MCFLCQRDDPFGAIYAAGSLGGSFGGKIGKIKAEIRALKRILLEVDEQKKLHGDACDKGEGTLLALREKQYELARSM